uniref:P-type domain-containing protein n=1 Tax=Globodera pallida TaxID=36090 RepID=A0A183C203_GLOPA
MPSFRICWRPSVRLFSLLLLPMTMLYCHNVSSERRTSFLVDGEVMSSSLNDGVIPVVGHRRWKSEGRTGILRTLLSQWHLSDGGGTPMDDDTFGPREVANIRQMINSDNERANNNGTKRKNGNRHRIAEISVKNGSLTHKTGNNGIKVTEEKQETLSKHRHIAKKNKKGGVGRAVTIKFFQHSNQSAILRGSSPAPPVPPSTVPQKWRNGKQSQLNAGHAGPPAIAPHSPGTAASPGAIMPQIEAVQKHNNNNHNSKTRTKQLLLRRIFTTGRKIASKNGGIINNATMLTTKVNGTMPPNTTNDDAIHRTTCNGTSNAKTATTPCTRRTDGCQMAGKQLSDVVDECHAKSCCCPSTKCHSTSAETVVAEVISSDPCPLNAGCQQTDQSPSSHDEDCHHNKLRKLKMRRIVFPALNKMENGVRCGDGGLYKSVDGSDQWR